jgi:hypothetical protein
MTKTKTTHQKTQTRAEDPIHSLSERAEDEGGATRDSNSHRRIGQSCVHGGTQPFEKRAQHLSHAALIVMASRDDGPGAAGAWHRISKDKDTILTASVFRQCTLTLGVWGGRVP